MPAPNILTIILLTAPRSLNNMSSKVVFLSETHEPMTKASYPDDNFKHQGLRKKLVSTIRAKGIKDERILAAVGAIPRHAFMDSGFIKFAYQDAAFPIGAGQTISQPYTVAFQTELLDLFDNCKVLEIGTGSGYQTAILAEMGARVYTIERIKSLSLGARVILAQLGYHAHFSYGDGYLGLPAYGPFDRILVTAGATQIPETLKMQLKIGGVLVAPIGGKSHQSMLRCVRTSEEEFEISDHGGFIFVPLLPGKTEK